MMYHRVHGVVTKYIAEFPAPHTPNLLTALATNNNDIHKAWADQEVGTGPTTAKRGQERTKLVTMLTKIENTGQVIGAALNDAAVIAQFSLDPAFSQMADEEFITSADALKTAATPLSAEFQSRGFAATFLADLQTQRDAFHNAVPAGSTVDRPKPLCKRSRPTTHSSGNSMRSSKTCGTKTTRHTRRSWPNIASPATCSACARSRSRSRSLRREPATT